MNRKILVLSALGFALAASAADAHRRYVQARVVGVEPIYETVVVQRPVRTCHREVVETYVSRPSVAGQTLAGAIVGAAIGRQFGGGSGRDALTLIGAAAGSAVANERALRRQSGQTTVVREPVERCTTTYRRQAERQLTGYWVDYRHRGRYYRVLRHERPGRFIDIVIGS